MLRLRQFFSAIWSDWGSRMSGPFTVPLGVLAFWVSGGIYKILWGVLASTSAMATIFIVWLNERKKVEGVELKLREITDKEITKRLVNHFYDRGLTLRNLSPGEDATEEEIKDWRSREDHWWQETLEILNSISPLAGNFFMDTERGCGTYHGSHESIWPELSLLSKKVKNLKVIIEKSDTYLVKLN